ncbi:uncharacterized protein LOC133881405 isoform X2 [Alnus glutinosa]|uniref:uncharacterized protein LOC133881405 isoform X2 n=1 Tax=Alnus glutinosa TaxID=3517 RepID=UPI002D7801D5|nr:uncharacterized protein LOC133881405 isoform X2 [Alnus glutinosa]
MHTVEENVSRPTKRQASNIVGPASSKRIKLQLVRSKKSVPETVRGKGMHTSSSNVATMGTQPSHAAILIPLVMKVNQQGQQEL